jgi:hypothetical protein
VSTRARRHVAAVVLAVIGAAAVLGTLELVAPITAPAATTVPAWSCWQEPSGETIGAATDRPDLLATRPLGATTVDCPTG